MLKTARPLLVLCALLVAACSGASATPAPASLSATTSSPAPAVLPSAGPATRASQSPSLGPDPTVWLCRPGLAGDPCAGDLTTTVIDSKGGRSVSRLTAAADPPIDCFYVYPTVSRQKTMNASLAIDPEEKAVAVAQAALFSQVCKVYAPIYPQITLAALASGNITLTEVLEAYNGVQSAFDEYLSRYNHGRGVVLIGHSQGAMLLTGLVRNAIDARPDVRKLLVSALLIGANVTVSTGQDVGGDFANVPACRSADQVGCVVAYSSFAGTPPVGAAFGRVDSALGLFDGVKTDRQILCVNPGSPGGGAASLSSFLPTSTAEQFPGAPRPAPKTAFVAYSGVFTGECRAADGASWLQIGRAAGSIAGPTLTASDPLWGLHTVDVSLAIGNLVELVRSESVAYAAN